MSFKTTALPYPTLPYPVNGPRGAMDSAPDPATDPGPRGAMDSAPDPSSLPKKNHIFDKLTRCGVLFMQKQTPDPGPVPGPSPVPVPGPVPVPDPVAVPEEVD